MEKREFLKGAAKLAALAPASALATTDKRLFGTPSSVLPIDPALQNKMRLGFARAAIPTEVWDDVAGFASGLHLLDTSQDARQRFSVSPQQYFESFGVRTGTRFAQSREMAMARLIMDDQARSDAATGNYTGFMQRLKEFNLPVLPDASVLTAEVTRLLRNNNALYESIKKSLETHVGERTQATLSMLDAVNGGTGAEASAAVGTDTVAVIHVFVVGHISVAAEVFAVSAAVVLIFVIGAQRPMNGRSPNAGRFSQLDPTLIESAATATSMARMLGNSQFEVKIARDMLAREVEAVIGATEAVGLISMEPAVRSHIVAECVRVAESSVGLTT